MSKEKAEEDLSMLCSKKSFLNQNPSHLYFECSRNSVREIQPNQRANFEKETKEEMAISKIFEENIPEKNFLKYSSISEIKPIENGNSKQSETNDSSIGKNTLFSDSKKEISQFLGNITTSREGNNLELY